MIKQKEPLDLGKTADRIQEKFMAQKSKLLLKQQ